MFTWNTENVLCGIDAGIVEIAETFNSSYLFLVRDGNSLPFAFTAAMTATLIHLRDIEYKVAAESMQYDRILNEVARRNVGASA